MYNLRLQYPKSDPMNLIAKLLMNSLYGKFGMKNENTLIDIFNTNNKKELNRLSEMLDTHTNTIQDFIKLGNHIIIVRKSIQNFNNDEVENYHGLEVNVALASAITGGGRMWMTLLKNNPNFNLYYSDTDSGVIDAPLPSHMVGGALGQFKLEHTINKAVFLAPKVYGFINIDGDEIIKIKGLSNDELNIKFNDLESLLIKDSSKHFTQEKWFKKVIEGQITVAEVAYTLKVTSNKREAVYIDNVFTNTNPFNYDDINVKSKY